MALNENVLQQLQRYLDQDLSAEELQAFEQELQTNEALTKELALHKEMQTLLADTPENDLRKNLQELSANFQETPASKDNPLKYLLVLIPLLLLAMWWILPASGPDETNNEDPKIELPAEEFKEDGAKPLTPSNSAPTLPGEIEKTEQDKKSQQIDQPNVPQDNSPPPIAANFTPNPSLDFLIGNNVRNNDFKIKALKTQSNIQLSSSNEAFNFEFVAELKSLTDLSDKSIKLHLFSNDKAAFENFSPLSTDDISLEDLGKSYKIDFQKNMNLPPGLYYYVLEEPEEETIYFVEKFTVQ